MRDLVDEINSSIGKKLEDFQKMTREFENYEEEQEESEDESDIHSWEIHRPE